MSCCVFMPVIIDDTVKTKPDSCGIHVHFLLTEKNESIQNDIWHGRCAQMTFRIIEKMTEKKDFKTETKSNIHKRKINV